MVTKLLGGELRVDQFERIFYHYFLDEVPNCDLDDVSFDFYSNIQEKLDWTTRNPNKEEIQYGWISHEEYIDYVKKLYGQFKTDLTS